MSSLYELTNEMLALKEMAFDPEVDEEIFKDTMEALEGELEAKADGYAMVIADAKVAMAELDARAKAIEEEAARIKGMSKAIGKNIERMMGNLESSMRATGKLKFKTDLFNFNIKKNPAKLVLAEDIDINSIPAEFLRFKEPEIVKDEVKKAIKAGEEFAWASLVQEEKLTIK